MDEQKKIHRKNIYAAIKKLKFLRQIRQGNDKVWQGPANVTWVRAPHRRKCPIRRNEVVYQTLFVAHACALCIVRVFYGFHLMTLTPAHNVAFDAMSRHSQPTDLNISSMLSIFWRKPLSPHIKRNDVGLTPLENGKFDIRISNDFGLFFSFGFRYWNNNSGWSFESAKWILPLD